MKARLLTLTSLTALLFTLLLQQTTLAALPAQTADDGPLPSLAPMLERVNPAVVNIATFSTQQLNYNPLLNDPFFRRFFNIPEEEFNNARKRSEKRQRSAGSGVIVDAGQGIVMTNYHVVKGADEVHVGLIDGRDFKATVVGSDPELDIAILKIDASNLAQVKLADSSHLRVGDFVVAIGNPFGLGQTVTTGIVSALDRSGLGIEGYENFIQTDASINPGNSGGALVNLRGELVGINTAIISPAGGNVGIGFAIPVNMAQASMRQILAYGEVKRGQLGVSIQDITPELREAFNLRNGQKGVLITDIASDSPAEKAGLRSGDIILSLNEQKTETVAQLKSKVAMNAVGETVSLEILRDSQAELIEVMIAEQISFSGQGKTFHPLLEGAQFSDAPKGGVLISALKPNSKAAYSGLRPGDIIVSANKLRIYDTKSLRNALRKHPDSVLLRIQRDNMALYVVIR